MRLRTTHQSLYPGPRRPAPVQPSRYHACGEGPSHGETRSRQDLHVARRETEFDDPNADAPAHAVDECVLEEVGEPVGCVLPALRLLQLLPDSPDVARHTCNGIQPHRSRLDNCRTAPLRLKLAA